MGRLTIRQADDVALLFRLLNGGIRWPDLDPRAPTNEVIAAAMERMAADAGAALQMSGTSFINRQQIEDFLDEWRGTGEWSDERSVETIDTQGRT